MIIKFKIFEKLDIDEPKRDDYVICTNKYWTDDQNKFFLTHIGRIISISYNSDKPIYGVRYDPYGDGFKEFPTRQLFYPTHSMTFWRNEVIHWSDNIQELEQFTDLYNDVFKYNL